jgi:hypothetical protein
MKGSLRRHPSPAMVVAFVALLAALSGTAIALPGTNTIRSKDIKTSNVRGSDIRTGAVRSGDVGDDSLTGADIAESSLGKVPSAASADNATSAASAASAATAANAAALGGIDASAYAKNLQLGPFESSPTDSDDIKSIVFDCPAGTVAIGAGAFTTFQFGAPAGDIAAVNREVVLTDNNRAQTTDPTLWRVTATETDLITANWSLSGQAICLG